jgi:hypothetical protein
MKADDLAFITQYRALDPDESGLEHKDDIREHLEFCPNLSNLG